MAVSLVIDVLGAVSGNALLRRSRTSFILSSTRPRTDERAVRAGSAARARIGS
jgi:hypothetical protein